MTFGVSASPFDAKTAIQQFALDDQRKYPLAAQAVMDSFYVDESWMGQIALTKLSSSGTKRNIVAMKMLHVRTIEI